MLRSTAAVTRATAQITRGKYVMRSLSIKSALPMVLAPVVAFSQAPEPKDTTLGKKPPEGAVVLLGPGDELSGWVKVDGKTPADWPLEDGILTVGAGKGTIMTKQTFDGDYTLHVEFNVPYMPEARGQGRGNSGVYLQGRCELQVLDSYGLDSQDNDCGGIYKQHAPAVNACKPPLQWQTYDIEFQAPVVRDGEVAKKARVTIRQNDLVIHDDVEIETTPGGIEGDTLAEGPLLLQDHGNAVQYRNIWLLPKK